jgi:hypothetical protein
MGWIRTGTWLFGVCLAAVSAASDEGTETALRSGETEIEASPEAAFSSPWNLGYADFLPHSAGSDDCLYDVPSEGNGGFLSANGPGVVCCAVAGVHLPDGATVTSAFFYLRDSSADDITLSLRRKRIDDETSSTVMGTITTSGTDTSVRLFGDVSIANGVVDNRNYTYFVSTDTCLDQDLNLRLFSGLLFFSEGS